MSTALMNPPSGKSLPAPAAAPPAEAVMPEAPKHLSAKVKNASAFGVSLTVHLVALLSMGLIHQAVVISQPEVQVESVFSEERPQQEFTQVMETDTRIAETVNVVSGSTVATSIGNSLGGGGTGTGGGGGGTGTGSGTIASRIGSSMALNGPSVRFNSGDIGVPGDGILSEDLGAGGVRGEGGAFVGDYGAALGRMTQELIRIMRSEPVMAVWLFDESESMKDDQKEIREKFHKVYEELGIISKKDADLKKKNGQEVLLTSVIGFGEKYHPITPKPTADIAEIRAAIDKIAIDDSGKENTCAAIIQAIDEHRQQAVRQKRKLVIIIVSDESGDDGEKVEDALSKAKAIKAPIYIMGREAIFGYPFARVRWQDPKYGLTHWLVINRGPETAFRECLQWDGLHERWDAFSSGFGPYEQVRLAKESGGVFFVLPGEEENLSGAGAQEKRQFDALDMKEYEPLMISRRDYMNEVSQSKFRSTISECIRIMDPKVDTQLNIRSIHYPVDLNEFKAAASQEVVKASRAMNGLNQVIPMLEGLKPLRAKEESERWRANYDLIMAQCYAYRIRLFQFLLAMDQHAMENPKITKPNSNMWSVARVPKMIEPDESQFGRLKAHFKIKSNRAEYLAELKEQEKQARELFEFVTTEHPGTPYARRAQYELGMGFGMTFYDHFHDPRYRGLDIKYPKF